MVPITMSKFCSRFGVFLYCWRNFVVFQKSTNLAPFYVSYKFLRRCSRDQV